METGSWGDGGPARRRGGRGPLRVLSLRGEGSAPPQSLQSRGDKGPERCPAARISEAEKRVLQPFRDLCGQLGRFGGTGGSEGQAASRHLHRSSVASETRATVFIHPAGTGQTPRPPCLSVVSCKCPFSFSCNLGDCVWLAVSVSFRILV